MKLLRKKQVVYFIENTVSLFALKLIDLGLTIFLIPFLILIVGLDNYGRYAFAVSFVLFFVNIVNYGFELNTVRSIAKCHGNTQKINGLVNEVFSVKLYLTVVLFSVLLLCVALLPAFSNNPFLFVFASSLLIADAVSLRWFFMGIEKMKFIPIINGIGTLLYISLVVLFLKTTAGYKYIALFEGVAMFIVNGVSFLWVLKKYQFKLKFIPLNQALAYLRKYWSSFVNLFIPSMLSNTAVFLVGLFGLPAHVSIVQLGVKVANGFSTVNTIITKVFYAMVNRNIQVFRKSVWVTLSLGVFLSIAMFISAALLIEQWLQMDDPITEAHLIFCIQLLSPTPLLMAVISAYGVNGLLVFGKDTLFGTITIFSALIAFIVGMVVIPSNIVIGGIVFLLVARGLYALGSFLLFHKKRFLKLTVKNK